MLKLLRKLHELHMKKKTTINLAMMTMRHNQVDYLRDNLHVIGRAHSLVNQIGSGFALRRRSLAHPNQGNYMKRRYKRPNQKLRHHSNNHFCFWIRDSTIDYEGGYYEC